MAAKKDSAKEAEQKFVLRLPESLHRSLRHVAIDRGTSLNKMIAEVLEEWWAKQPEREKYSTRTEERDRRRPKGQRG